VTETLLVGLAQVLAAAAGAWLAVRVELRWLRADVDRHERKLDAHDTRIIVLEVEVIK